MVVQCGDSYRLQTFRYRDISSYIADSAQIWFMASLATVLRWLEDGEIFGSVLTEVSGEETQLAFEILKTLSGGTKRERCCRRRSADIFCPDQERQIKDACKD